MVCREYHPMVRAARPILSTPDGIMKRGVVGMRHPLFAPWVPAAVVMRSRLSPPVVLLFAGLVGVIIAILVLGPPAPSTYEELLEIAPGRYLRRDLWDQGYLEDPETGEPRPLPQGARAISRQFRGAYVVFAKASVYNEIDPYQGHHAKVSGDAFRRQIEDLLRKYGPRLRRPRTG